jgi:hypothetical protein
LTLTLTSLDPSQFSLGIRSLRRRKHSARCA